MRQSLRFSSVCVVLLAVSAPLAANPAQEFYLSLQRRGVAAFNTGQFEEAATHLRVAAFGLVDAIDLYASTQVYLALASERLGHTDQARDAAQRLLAAERVMRTYGSLRLPNEVGSAFENLARRLLTANELAFLRGGAPTPAPARPQFQTVGPAPATPPPTTAEPPQPQPAITRGEPRPPAQPAPGATPSRAEAPHRVPERFLAAEAALNTSNLEEARSIYGQLLSEATLSRADLLRVTEGLYRARDFRGTLAAFDRLGTLRQGEEPYRFYRAVALYETGSYRAAKAELSLALPHIAASSDVARYRARIEGAID